MPPTPCLAPLPSRSLDGPASPSAGLGPWTPCVQPGPWPSPQPPASRAAAPTAPLRQHREARGAPPSGSPRRPCSVLRAPSPQRALGSGPRRLPRAPRASSSPSLLPPPRFSPSCPGRPPSRLHHRPLLSVLPIPGPPALPQPAVQSTRDSSLERVAPEEGGTAHVTDLGWGWAAGWGRAVSSGLTEDPQLAATHCPGGGSLPLRTPELLLHLDVRGPTTGLHASDGRRLPAGALGLPTRASAGGLSLCLCSSQWGHWVPKDHLRG